MKSVNSQSFALMKISKIIQFRLCFEYQFSDSAEKLSSRRHSGSRAMRLGTSKSDTSHNASHGPATPTTPPSASEKQTTITLASASATPKQLRFTGISPSPTPSPSMAHLSISLETEKSTEVTSETCVAFILSEMQ